MQTALSRVSNRVTGSITYNRYPKRTLLWKPQQQNKKECVMFIQQLEQP